MLYLVSWSLTVNTAHGQVHGYCWVCLGAGTRCIVQCIVTQDCLFLKPHWLSKALSASN